jgi:hypothetical protein
MESVSVQSLIKWFKNFNPNKAESTYLGFKYGIIRIEKILNLTIADININDFSDLDRFNKGERVNNYSLNTRIQTNLAVLNIIKYLTENFESFAKSVLIKKWDKRLNTLTIEKKEQNLKQSLTTKEALNWVDYDVLKDKFIQYIDYQIIDKNIEFSQIRNILLMGLLVLIPPTRIGNYQFMKLRYMKKAPATHLMKKHNYIMMNENNTFTLCFNKYKTSKFIGQISKDIKSERLIKLVNQYIIKRKSKVNNIKNTHFFVNQFGKEMTQTNITDTLKCVSKKITGKELSVNMFRHIFLTHYGKEDHSIKANMNLADFMGQTYNPTQQERYKKYEADLIKEKNKIMISFD